LVADIAGCSRLARADEDRILARLRTLWSDLIDPLAGCERLLEGLRKAGLPEE
jgi:hypothetical protein